MIVLSILFLRLMVDGINLFQFIQNMESHNSLKTAKRHIINYSDLQLGKDLSQVIEQAYGPQGQGVLFVDNIPDYPELRKQTLPLFHKLANLSAQVLKKYERPDIGYELGWTHGLEKINGKYDTCKGSFMYRCTQDQPVSLTQEQKEHYTQEEIKIHNESSNIWIEQIPQIQENLKKLSKVMTNVGKMIGHQIDIFAEKNVKGYEKGKMSKAMNRSKNFIGRALHYFPYQKESFQHNDLICGWHNDYELLTTLTSALYTDENGKPIEQAIEDGLIVKNRFVEQVKLAIPQNMLAIQLAEVTQVWTGGLLEATPHAVLKDPKLAGKKISRNTLVIFHGPHDLEIVQPPQQIDPSNFLDKKPYNVPPLKDRWSKGINYKDLLKKNYQYYS